jgi:hypothetical protein
MPARSAIRVLLPLLASAALAAGVGACDATLDPIRVAAGCPERPVRGPDAWAAAEPHDQLIDDFDDGDEFLPAVGARNGAWILGMESSPGMLTAEVSSRCAARGAAAGHFAGSGFTSWGANWTAVFRNNNGGTAVPFDGGAYRAISFWAAAGAGAAVPLAVPVGLTTMDVAWNSGGCTTCMDFYATTVSLTRAWQRMVVPFADLVQSGFGVPQAALRRDQLVGFIIWPRQQFDVWIDDVRFEP